MALADYLDIDESDVEVTPEEQRAAAERANQEFRDAHGGQTYSEWYESQGFGDGVTQQGADRAYDAIGAPMEEYAQAAARE